MKQEEAIKASGGEFCDPEKARQDPEFQAQMKSMRTTVNEVFDVIDRLGGNAQSAVETAMDASLHELQARVIRYVGGMLSEDSEAISRSLVTLSVLITVVMNNPMYGSHALRLQLQAEFDRHIREASMIKLR